MKRLLRHAVRGRGSKRRIGLSQVHPEDTFIVSFPKSGNTWVRFLIACIQDPEAEVSFRNIERFVPDIHKSRERVEAMPPPRFIKCHTPSFDSFPRFVYLLRDGRDAMVSFYHYSVGRESFSGSLREFIHSDAARRYGTWIDHTLDAVSYAESHPERVLVVRYEELIAAPMHQARRIAAFCRLGSNEPVVRRAVERCRFSRLQEVERRYGGEVLKGPTFTFFRCGQEGQWRDAATSRELAPFIEAAEPALSSLGYTV